MLCCARDEYSLLASGKIFCNNNNMSGEKSEQLEKELKGERTEDEVCASCGIAAIDDIKLKDCIGGCDLVKYCNDECQTNHREQHEEECKTRKAESLDKKLFTQPDVNHLGECPICCLPMPLDPEKSTLMGCCCKIICDGCNYANKKREIEGGLEHRCAFCREPVPKSQEEFDKIIMERVKKNDPVAMAQMGTKHYKEGEYEKALECYTKAAVLGDVDAHNLLGRMCFYGRGVEKKDEKKAVHHWEQAAVRGDPNARGFLAVLDKRNGRFERAAKHYIINANLGEDGSLNMIKDLFVDGIVSKEEYTAALRGYQAAVDATKSAERERAEAIRREQKQLDGTNK